jgi:flagellar protein FlaG
MASDSVTQMIFFVAALVVSSVVAAVMLSTVQETSNVFNQKSRSLVESIKDDITIINDPDNVSNNPVIIYAKNTGESTVALDKKMFDVIIDGVYYTNYSVSSLSGNSEWQPSDVAKITINTTLSSGTHSIRVYVRGNEWDEMKFRI